jgi:hypothetical protein
LPSARSYFSRQIDFALDRLVRAALGAARGGMCMEKKNIRRAIGGEAGRSHLLGGQDSETRGMGDI